MPLFKSDKEPADAEYAIMDEQEEPGQFYEGLPVPVRITGEAVKSEAAERVSYNQYALTGANTQPTYILPRNPNRKRAIIQVVAQTNSPVFLLHNDPSIVMQNGFRLLGATSSIEIKNQRALWGFITGPAGSTINISVMDEYYDLDAENPKEARP
jgi:hypothetical protein